jgi:hypothetical protein
MAHTMAAAVLPCVLLYEWVGVADMTTAVSVVREVSGGHHTIWIHDFNSH